MGIWSINHEGSWRSHSLFRELTQGQAMIHGLHTHCFVMTGSDQEVGFCSRIVGSLLAADESGGAGFLEWLENALA
jgi:hypothetical protein